MYLKQIIYIIMEFENKLTKVTDQIHEEYQYSKYQ